MFFFFYKILISFIHIHLFFSANKNDFDVPMIYDPKFQRGPLDPYGRPPRIGNREKKNIN